LPYVGRLPEPVHPKHLADAVQLAFSGKVLMPSSLARPTVDRPQRLAGLRLLVVEDNMLNRQVADELLTGEGAQVTLAEGGLEGVSKVANEHVPFDAVLMDIQMPDIDGLEATRRIRSNPRFATLPIVAMTANASSTDREACLAAGMNEHVGNTVDLEQLIVTLLYQTGREDSRASSEIELAGTKEVLIEHRESIISRFGGNLELIRNVLRNFGPELEKQLVRLHDQIQRQDAKGAALVLHTIKGSSGTMGASALSLLAGKLEYKLKHEDAKSLANTFADPAWFDELGGLLQQSIEQMNAEFGQNPPAEISDGKETMEPTHWKECLKEILLLLETGNLQAIEFANGLVSKTPSSLRPQFDELVVMVQSLDFGAAIPIGHDLLRSA